MWLIGFVIGAFLGLYFWLEGNTVLAALFGIFAFVSSFKSDCWLIVGFILIVLGYLWIYLDKRRTHGLGLILMICGGLIFFCSYGTLYATI